MSSSTISLSLGNKSETVMLSPTTGSVALEQAMCVAYVDEEDSSENSSSDGDDLFGCDGLEEDELSQGTTSAPSTWCSFTAALGRRHHGSAASLRSPSVLLRHEAALRSFQIKATSNSPPPCPLPPSPSGTSSSSNGDVLESLRLSDEHHFARHKDDDAVLQSRIIEIEQDCQEEEDYLATTAAAPLSGREAASQRMLSALSRSPNVGFANVAVGAPPRRPLPKLKSFSARRIATTSHKPLPSLEQVSSSRSVSASSPIVGVGTPAPCALTPAPRTPGTASPCVQPRSVSCPSTLPRKQYGTVEVYITPPTPRPAQGAIRGVVLSRPGLPPRVNSSPNVLSVPAFDMAPGRARMEREREKEAALKLWNAWQHQASVAMEHSPAEQKVWREHASVNPWLVQLQVLAGLGSPTPARATVTPPTYTPTEAGSATLASFSHAQQRTMPRAPRRGSVGEASQSTWWRAPSSAPIVRPGTPKPTERVSVDHQVISTESVQAPPSAPPACLFALPLQRSTATPPTPRRSSPAVVAQSSDARAAARASMLLKLGKRASMPPVASPATNTATTATATA